MSSHLLNYRFSPDQSDTQCSPPRAVSAVTRWWTCEQRSSAWPPRLPQALQPSRPPRRGTSTHHLPFALLFAPPALFNGKSECREREIPPAVRGRREKERMEGPSSLGLWDPPSPFQRVGNWTGGARFALEALHSDFVGWLSLAMAAEVLCWCIRGTQSSPSALLLVRACLRLAVISSDL